MAERFVHDFDWLILVPALLLIGFGLLTLYSVGHVPDGIRETIQPEESRYFEKQLVRCGIGLVVLAIAVVIPFGYFEWTALATYIVCLVFLLATFLLEPSRGASRWISIGGLRFQPSEFMKIGVIFLLAKFLSAKRNDPNNLRVLAVSFAIVCVPFLLIVKQPDLGTSLVFPALLIAMLYWRGLNEGILILIITPVISAFLTVYSQWTLEKDSYPFLLLVFFLLILVIAYRRRRNIFQSIVLVGMNLAVMLIVPNLWNRLQVYQQKRILAFLHPESDILGAGWQVYQSKVAIGSGGFLGKQFLHGTQKLLAFLPERHSDFVYSVISEELGYLGAVGILVLFAIIIIRALYLATKMKNRFASMATLGICAYFAFHVIVNTGMTVGLAPVTGLPLPFMSYGGSSMIVSCFLIGLLLNFSIRFHEY